MIAQEPFYVNYTDEDGLPTNELYGLFQSSDGLIWINSDAGLIRFDGVYYKVFENKAAKNQSIDGVIEDKNGRLWCHNFANQVFYFENDSLYLYEPWETIKRNQKINVAINHLTLQKENIYLQTNRLCYIDVNDNYKLKESSSKFFENNGSFYHFLFDKESIYIYNFYRLLYIENGNIDTISRPKLLEAKQKNLPNGHLIKHDNKVFYIVKREEITNIPLVYLLKKNEAIPYDFPNTLDTKKLHIAHVQPHKKNEFWISCNEGLLLWNYQNNTIQHYFKGKFISDVQMDFEGNLWVSSLKEGLFFIPSFQIKTLTYFTNNIVTDIKKDKSSNLLIAHSGNQISYINSTSYQELFNYNFNSKAILNTISYDKYADEFYIFNSLGTTHIFSLEDRQVSTKLTHESAKSAIFDSLDNIIFTNYRLVKSMNKVNNRETMIHPYWQSLDGLVKDTANVKYYDRYYKYYTILDGNRPYTILLQERDYILWIGVFNELWYFKDGIGHQCRVENDKSIIAKTIVETNDSTIWVGTLKDGLYKIVNQKPVEHFTVKDGLSNNNIYKIVRQGYYLWLGTEKGLNRFDTQTNEFVQWNNFGLPYFRIKSMEIVDNQLFVSDGKQIFIIDTEQQFPKIITPRLLITDFRVNEKSYDWTKKIRLAADENNIEIDFRGIAYKSQGNFKYEYRLLNVENKWNAISSTNQTIRYPDLNHGNYTFEIKVVNSAGVESNIKRLSFTINPPFYLTWWFLSLSILTIGTLIYWFIDRRIKLLNRRNQQKLERSQLERDLRISQLKAIKAQMNPHFVFNVLNSIQGLYAVNDKKQANILLSEFAHLIRLTLEMSDELTVSLNREIELLELYLSIENTRIKNTLNYIIDNQIYDDLEEIYIPSLLIQPYVENAIKHGLLHKQNDRNLVISFRLNETDSTLIVTIDDNGIGRIEAQKIKQQQSKFRSFSTFANEKRLQLLNVEKHNKIGVEYIDKYNDNNSIGTKVILTIPVEL